MDEKYRSYDIDYRLRKVFREVPNARTDSAGGHKIALRMTRGPTNSCIDFHCDGGYASSTSQIPLNSPSEYEGGKLCFFVNNQIHEISRSTGSLVQHPPNVLHGVTSVTDGTRKSLFIVDRTNGLGEKGVVTLTEDHVVSFLAQRASRRDDRATNGRSKRGKKRDQEEAREF